MNHREITKTYSDLITTDSRLKDEIEDKFLKETPAELSVDYSQYENFINFSSATKLKALNVAQTTVVNFLNDAYLTELEIVDSITIEPNALSARGYFALGDGTSANTTANKPIRNSVKMVQIAYSSNAYKWAIIVAQKDIKKLDNSYLASSTDNPIVYVFSNRLYVRPQSGIVQARIYYIKEPTAIATNNTSDLNASLHEIVVDLAESQLWRMDNEVNRSASAQTMAMTSIEMLNQRYNVEAPVGIGTKKPGSN